MIEIDQIGTMHPQKAVVRLQLSAQLVQTSGAFQNGSVRQMKKDRSMDHLAVFQLPQLDAA